MITKSKISISTGTLLRVVFLAAFLWLLYILKDLIVMLFAAIIVASVIEPLANKWERVRIPRALTVVIVYVGLILVLIGIGALMVEPLVEQTHALALAVPDVVSRLSNVATFLPNYDQEAIIGMLQEGLMGIGTNLANVSANVFESTRSIINNLVNFLFVFVIALYLVTERDALQKVARIVTPKPYEAFASRAIIRVQRGLGRWVLAQLTLGVTVGLIVGIGLWIMGVKYALLLAILAGVMEFIPVIGPIISAIPGILIALAHSPVLGLVAWIFYVIVGQFESHVLIPNIMKRAVGLKPLVTIIAVLIGARLLGVLGVLLAIPTATTIKVFLDEWKNSSFEEPVE